MNATIQDLELELWLRRRNVGELKWQMRDGKKIPLRDMTTEHIENAIKHFESKEEIYERL